jgi:ATP-dependent DNA helicase RecQ
MQQVYAALKKYFGYDTFRPMQEDIVRRVLDGKDSLVLMPTGGGKSICYQIPALVMEGTCVVVSPLISLMQDQVQGLRSNGVEAAFLNSTLSSSEAQRVETDFLDGTLKLLYVSPEKVVAQDFITLMKAAKVSLFAIDEAHCISAWGHDFRPEYTKMRFIKQQFAHVPMIALTATADKVTRRDILEQLQLTEPQTFISSFDRPNLSLTVVPGQKRIERILEFIASRPNQSGIVYCLSRKSTEEVAEKLRKAGIKAKHYHAQVPPQERLAVQQEFINDTTPIICATVAFGMGIDKPNVRWVIHYNLPKNVESYYQEIGRAGRDGLKSDTVLFYSISDAVAYRDMFQKAASENQFSSSENLELQLAKLDRMVQFADSLICRRKMLLNYFGESLEKDCGNCDVCKNPPQHFDGTVVAQKALSGIARLNQNAAMGLLIDVLRGSHRQEIVERGYDKIKTFGVGREFNHGEWQFYIAQMLNLGLVEVAYDQRHALKLTEASQDVLFKGKKVNLIQLVAHKKFTEKRVEEAKVKPKNVALQEELFERLRLLRKKIAQERGIPPYLVLGDVTLEQLASQRPTVEASLWNITGMGERKIQLYGSLFMNEIIEFVKQKTGDDVYIKGSTYVITYDMFKKGLSIDEIALARNLNPVTIYSHLAYLYEKGEAIDIQQFVTKEEVKKVIDVLPSMSEPYQLAEVQKAIEGLEYYKIRLALAYVNRNSK